MTTLQKLRAIEKQKTIYDIHYCAGGVGFLFFTGNSIDIKNDEWKRHLSVERYYPTFVKAVNAEYKKLYPF